MEWWGSIGLVTFRHILRRLVLVEPVLFLHVSCKGGVERYIKKRESRSGRIVIQNAV